MTFLERFKFEFTINTLFIGILFLIIGSGVSSYLLTKTDPYEVPTGAFPAPIQVGRNKIIVSKTGDASMRTEYTRRRTIVGSNSGPIKKFGFSGSTNGSLETFFLSSIWPTGVPYFPDVCTSVFDGGNAESEFCYILDGNGDSILVDGGYADTNVCST
jgi:hypothetical protein